MRVDPEESMGDIFIDVVFQTLPASGMYVGKLSEIDNFVLVEEDRSFVANRPCDPHISSFFVHFGKEIQYNVSSSKNIFEHQK